MLLLVAAATPVPVPAAAAALVPVPAAAASIIPVPDAVAIPVSVPVAAAAPVLVAGVTSRLSLCQTLDVDQSSLLSKNTPKHVF